MKYINLWQQRDRLIQPYYIAIATFDLGSVKHLTENRQRRGVGYLLLNRDLAPTNSFQNGQKTSAVVLTSGLPRGLGGEKVVTGRREDAGGRVLGFYRDKSIQNWVRNGRACGIGNWYQVHLYLSVEWVHLDRVCLLPFISRHHPCVFPCQKTGKKKAGVENEKQMTGSSLKWLANRLICYVPWFWLSLMRGFYHRQVGREMSGGKAI